MARNFVAYNNIVKTKMKPKHLVIKLIICNRHKQPYQLILIQNQYQLHNHTMKVFQLLNSIALGALLVYTAKATPLENNKPQQMDENEEGTRRLGQSHHKPVDLIKDATKLNTNTKIPGRRNLKENCNSACKACKVGCDLAVDVSDCIQGCYMGTCLVRPKNCDRCINNCKAPLFTCYRACELL